MDSMRATNRGRRSFREAEVAHLAGANQIRHGTDGFFDGSVGINAMLVIEVDGVDAESIQAGVATGTDILRLTADAANIGIGAIANNGELGSKENFVAAVANGLADQDLVVAVAVDIGSIQEIDAQFDGAMDCGDRFGVVARAIKFRHAHTPKAKWGNQGTILPKMTKQHESTSQELIKVRWMAGERRYMS